MAKSILAEFMQIREQRLALEKREKELNEQIKEKLAAGEKIRSRSHEAYLINKNRRSIEAGKFVEKFGTQAFMAVADVGVTKVDGLVKLNVIKQADVDSITDVTASQQVGVKAIKTV